MQSTVVTCDMARDCRSPITHIDVKGFVYCLEHGRDRQLSMRCRKMAAWELKLIHSGQPLPSYERGRKPKLPDFHF